MLALSLYQRRWLLVIAVSGFLVVALGAFAAHGLKPYLVDPAKQQNRFTSIVYDAFLV